MSASSVFELSQVEYFADPAAKPDQLVFDALLLLDAAAATVNTLAIGLSDSDSDIAVNPKSNAAMLWGVLHQVEMARGMATQASLRMSMNTSTKSGDSP